MAPPAADHVLRPQPGPQEDFLASSADIAIAGGAAGVGKTFGLVVEPLRHYHNPKFGAVIFRRDAGQLKTVGGAWEESEKIYPGAGGTPNQTTLTWKFPTGMRVSFAGMEHATDRFKWDGSQIPLIGFDQLESFEEIQFWYMLSRNRSTCGIRPYIRATCNPVPADDKIGGWLHRLIAWWINPETGYPIWERSGLLRWFIRVGDTLHWADSADALREEFKHLPPDDIQPKSLTFIPGLLKHNPILMAKDPGYRATLLAMPLVERERLLGGNWNIRPTAGKVFNRAWLPIVEAAPAGARWIRFWDKAGTKDDGDWSAGAKVGEHEGVWYIADMVRGQWSSGQRNKVMKQTAELDGPKVPIGMEQEPGSSGKESAEISIHQLAGFTVSAKTSTGDKVTRAAGLSAQAEAGNVRLVRGPWNQAFIDEAHAFPDGANDDQIDAGSGGFNALATGHSGWQDYIRQQKAKKAAEAKQD